MNEQKIYNIIHKVLLEYSSDQRLPFDDDYFKNKNYLEQYADWLEDFGKYGELPQSKLDFWTEMKKAIHYIVNNDYFIHDKFDYGLKNFSEENILNKLKIIIGEDLIIDDGNKIYVERQVGINSNANNYDKSDSDNKDPKLLYNELTKNYNNNVGGCWSYKKDGARAYCSISRGDIITLKGYIRTDDIDFVKTVLLNFRYIREHEIRVKPKSKIELFEVDFNCKYKIPLKGKLIVNATYFGNNGKFDGDYAHVDNGFGDYKLIDRKGNINDISAIIRNKISNKEYRVNKTFENGYSIVSINGLNKLTFIDKNENLISDLLFFDDCFKINGKNNDRIWACKKDGKYMIVNSKSNLIRNHMCWFDDVENYYESFAKVYLNDKYSLINSDGNLIGDGKLWFDWIDETFNEGFATIINNEKWSFIDKDGKLFGDGNFWFNYVTEFKHGVSIVKLNDKYTLLFINGTMLNNGKLWFDEINDFYDGYAMAKLNGTEYFISETGEIYTSMFEPVNDLTNENIDKVGVTLRECINNYLNRKA